MIQYTLNNYKKSRLVVIALWFVYAASYFIRTCYAASIASIVSEGEYTKGEVGLIGTAFFICYGVGQLISGLIGDKVNPFTMILFGSTAGAVSCFFMSFANSLAFMLVIWALNGFFQSMLWSPILRVFSETIDKRLQKKAILRIALSLPTGTICSYLVSTFVIKHTNWQYVFVCGGLCILAASAFAFVIWIYIKNDITKIQKQKIAVKTGSGDIKTKPNFFSIAKLSGLFIIIIPSFLHGMMRDGITNWVPTMISETYGVSASFSVFLTIVLPIFNAFGAYAVLPIYRKFGENEMKTAGAAGVIAIVPLVALMFMNKLSVYLVIVLLALTTSIMYALNYLIISLVPVRFSAYSCTSTVSGILNSAAHIGCAISSYGFGAVSEKSGWNAVILIWIVSSFLTAFFSFMSVFKWKNHIKNRSNYEYNNKS